MMRKRKGALNLSVLSVKARFASCDETVTRHTTVSSITHARIQFFLFFCRERRDMVLDQHNKHENLINKNDNKCPTTVFSLKKTSRSKLLFISPHLRLAKFSIVHNKPGGREAKRRNLNTFSNAFRSESRAGRLLDLLENNSSLRGEI